MGWITLGAALAGEILRGDLDVWTVSAIAGEHITVQINETADTGSFTPWIRLWAPSGASLGSNWGASAAAISSGVAPATGTYLVLVASNNGGFDGTGTYQLTVTKP
jgi:hypothetical protein